MGHHDASTKYVIFVSIACICGIWYMQSITSPFEFVHGNFELVHEKNPEKISPMQWTASDVKERFAMRNLHMREQCHKLHLAMDESVESSGDSIVSSQIVMAKGYNLLACINSKAGTGTWHDHFNKINNFRPNRYPSKASNQINSTELRRRMFNNDFIKILAVRHPLYRLVATYRSLFCDGVGRIPHSTIRAVVNKYLPKGTGHTNITFPQYIEAIVTQWQTHRTANKHWLGYNAHCMPCIVTYDYIIKMDTLAEDLKYVLDTTGINSTYIDVNSNRKSNITEDKKDSYLAYYDDVDQVLLQGMYDVYQQDFKLFDYEIPEFLQRAINNKLSFD